MHTRKGSVEESQRTAKSIKSKKYAGSSVISPESSLSGNNNGQGGEEEVILLSGENLKIMD